MNMRSLLTLHPLLSDRVRLAIMATLAASRDAVDFNSLLLALDLSRGNLSSHMRKLEEQQLVEVEKGFVDRKPRTTYRCTEQGKNEIKRYLEEIERVLKPKAES